MNYLLDTHIIVWWLTVPEKISPKAQQIIRDRKNAIYCSSVSFWEIAIKQGLGRLNVPSNFISLLKIDGFIMLPSLAEEALSLADLPPIHQDPFDRMLIVQAKLNNLTLISQDRIMEEYPIAVLSH